MILFFTPISIVGLPNVGKSTTFNLLTKLSVLADNYAFATKDPNKGRSQVPDERFDKLCDMYKPKQRIPNYLNLVDIAGLVKGAHTGAGIGNKFLDNIRQVDAIFHMVRIFDDQSISHVEDNVDPVRDMSIIQSELQMKDIQLLESFKETIERKRKGNKTLQEQYDLATKCIELLQQGKNIRDCEWTNAQVEVLRSFSLLTSKPMIYLLNCSEKEYTRQKSKWFKKVLLWIRANGNEPAIPFSAAMEKSLTKMTSEQCDEYLKSITPEGKPQVRSAIPKIIRSGYKMLNLITFFTCGPKEVRAWTIPNGITAYNAAAVIHTDIRDGFQSCSQMKYDELIEAGSEAALRAKGKVYTRGRNYIVEDGDILHFQHNMRKKKR